MSVLPEPTWGRRTGLRCAPPLSRIMKSEPELKFKFQIDGQPAFAADLAAAERDVRRSVLQATRDRNRTSARARLADASDARSVEARNRARTRADDAAAARALEQEIQAMGRAQRREAGARLREASRARPPATLTASWTGGGGSSYRWTSPPPRQITGSRTSTWRTAPDGKRSVVLSIRKLGFGKCRSGRKKGQSGWSRGSFRRTIRYIVRPEALEQGADSIIALIPGMCMQDPRALVAELLEVGSAIETLEEAAAGDARHLFFASIIIPLPAELSPAARRALIVDIFRPEIERGLPVIAALHAPDDIDTITAITGSIEQANQQQANFHAHVLVGLRPVRWLAKGRLALSARRATDALADIPDLRQRIADSFNRQLEAESQIANFTGISARDRRLVPAADKHRGPRPAAPERTVETDPTQSSPTSHAASQKPHPEATAAIPPQMRAPREPERTNADTVRPDNSRQGHPPAIAESPARFSAPQYSRRPESPAVSSQQPPVVASAIEAARAAARLAGNANGPVTTPPERVLPLAPPAAAPATAAPAPAAPVAPALAGTSPLQKVPIEEEVITEPPAKSASRQPLAKENLNDHDNRTNSGTGVQSPWQIDIYRANAEYLSQFDEPGKRACMRDMSECHVSSVRGGCPEYLHADPRHYLDIQDEQSAEGVSRKGSGAPQSPAGRPTAMSLDPETPRARTFKEAPPSRSERSAPYVEPSPEISRPDKSTAATAEKLQAGVNASIQAAREGLRGLVGLPARRAAAKKAKADEVAQRKAAAEQRRAAEVDAWRCVLARDPTLIRARIDPFGDPHQPLSRFEFAIDVRRAGLPSPTEEILPEIWKAALEVQEKRDAQVLAEAYTAKSTREWLLDSQRRRSEAAKLPNKAPPDRSGHGR